MKSFKNYMTEGSSDADDPGVFYVKVDNGRAHLCSTKTTGPCSSFGTDVISAVIQGSTVVLTAKNGKTSTWRIQPDSRSVVGPLTSF
jgi:hypothetical protein